MHDYIYDPNTGRKRRVIYVTRSGNALTPVAQLPQTYALARAPLALPGPVAYAPQRRRGGGGVVFGMALLAVGLVALSGLFPRLTNATQDAPQAVSEAPGATIGGVVVREEGDTDVRGAASISASQIDTILREYNSPAVGSGAAWVALGAKYNLDPAYAVAFFVHESSAGTNPQWAGLKGGGRTTHNVGNIICAGYPTCYGRFRDYPSWEAGIEDWYKLIATEYVQGRGTTTLAEILPIYAPSVENDTQGYIRTVQRMVEDWRRQAASALPQQLAADGAVLGESAPLTLADDLGFNVLAALNASGGALRMVAIAPGATWSFNAAMGNPALIEYRTLGGVPGGGWCDLAARYIQAVRPVLPSEAIRFEHHGLKLADVAWADSVAIWNTGGQAGSGGAAQDLEITNTTGQPLVLTADDIGGAIVVHARRG